MAEPSTPFALALSRHDQRVLRAAFEACNAEGETSYNRTTLLRWLDRSVPRNGEFVQCLADRLEAPALFEAWQLARRGSGEGGGNVEGAINRFRSLSEEDRAAAFPKIRRLFLERYGSQRARLSFRVDLYDSDNGDADFFDLRLVVKWTGRLPEYANVAFVVEQAELGNAFEDPSCVFRDALAMDNDALIRLLEGAEQTLSYKPLDEDNPTFTTMQGSNDGSGVFKFENDRIDNAEVRLDLNYPYPKRQRSFPIRFGKYKVAGVVDITFAAHSTEIANPHCNGVFLPPGDERSWAAATLPRNEFVVYLGKDDLLLSEGDGALLSWT